MQENCLYEPCLAFPCSIKGNYGHGSLARKRIENRPQLSESEDPDSGVGGRTLPLNPHSLKRQESFASKSKSLTRSISGPRYSAAAGGDPPRSVSVPPPPAAAVASYRPLASGPPGYDYARDPAYWGIAYPLNHDVLYPRPVAGGGASPRLDLPAMIGAWLNVAPRHVATNCLACCRLRPSARPRAASLSVAKDDPRYDNAIQI